MRFKLCEVSSAEVKRIESSNNKNAKIIFNRKAKDQNIPELKKNSVAHHIQDTKNSIGVKKNNIENYIFIPNVNEMSQYAQFIHKLMHLKETEFSNIDIHQFLSKCLAEPIYSIQSDGKIHTTKLQDYFRG